MLAWCNLIKEIRIARNPLQLSRAFIDTRISNFSQRLSNISGEERVSKPHPEVSANPFQMWLGGEWEPGCLAQPPTGWADLPYQPSPSSALANTLSPTRVPGPLLSAMKCGCRVSQGSYWSLIEKEGASEAPAMSFGGPKAVKEVALWSTKENFGDHHSSRGLLVNAMLKWHRHHDCSSSHSFPRSCLTSPKSCRLTPTLSD